MSDYDTMGPGREMDARVAEKVFGLEVMDDFPEVFAVGADGANAVVRKYMRHYSTDISAAWEVVEKLRSDRLWFTMMQDNTDIWDVKLWRGESKGWFPTVEYYGNAPTAPLAICRAALKAVDHARPYLFEM